MITRGPANRLMLGAIVAMFAASVVAACAGGSPYATALNPSVSGSPSPSPFPSPTSSPSPSPSPTTGASCITPIAPSGTQVIGVDLNATPCTDQTYQTVTGYFGGTTLVTSQVIGLTHSPSNIVEFMNIDNQPHTAANLGPWSGSYPAQGPNPAATPSPKLADISTTGFTAGNLNPGSTSRHYTANVPGIYVFGCAYHYNTNNMRTVIIVQ